MNWKLIMPVVLMFACGGTPEDEKKDEFETGSNTTEEELLTPVDFNNEISFMQNAVLDQIDVLFKSDSTNVDVNFENSMLEIDLNIASLNAMKAPDGGDSMRLAMLDLLDFYKTELTGEFQEIIVLIKKPIWLEADAKRIEAFDLEFATGEKRLFEKVLIQQEKFAKANRIELQEI